MKTLTPQPSDVVAARFAVLPATTVAALYAVTHCGLAAVEEVTAADSYPTAPEGGAPTEADLKLLVMLGLVVVNGETVEATPFGERVSSFGTRR